MGKQKRARQHQFLLPLAPVAGSCSLAALTPPAKPRSPLPRPVFAALHLPSSVPTRSLQGGHPCPASRRPPSRPPLALSRLQTWIPGNPVLAPGATAKPPPSRLAEGASGLATDSPECTRRRRRPDSGVSRHSAAGQGSGASAVGAGGGGARGPTSPVGAGTHPQRAAAPPPAMLDQLMRESRGAAARERHKVHVAAVSGLPPPSTLRGSLKRRLSPLSRAPGRAKRAESGLTSRTGPRVRLERLPHLLQVRAAFSGSPDLGGGGCGPSASSAPRPERLTAPSGPAVGTGRGVQQGAPAAGSPNAERGRRGALLPLFGFSSGG